MGQDSRPVLMVIEQASSFHSQLAGGLSRVLEAHGIPLLIHTWGHTGASPTASLVRTLRHAQVRGVVVTQLTHADSTSRVVKILRGRPEVPQVFLCMRGPGRSVRADNVMGMHLVAEHLVRDCEVRRPLIVRGVPHQPDSQERGDAVCEAFARLAVPVLDQNVVDGLFNREESHLVVLEALRRDPEIDAVVAANDRSALGAIDAARELGLRVPDDLVVTGFDDEEFAAFAHPSLTTVSQDLCEQGALAGSMLVRLMDGEPVEDQRMPVRLVVRHSTQRGIGRPGPEEAASKAVQLWERAIAMDATITMSKALMFCSTMDDLVQALVANFPLIGTSRAFLVVRADELGSPRGRLAMAYFDGRLHDVTPQDTFDVAEILPGHLQDHLERGTLMMQPLVFDDCETGYVLLDGTLRRSTDTDEILRMDLSRTIDIIQRTTRLDERTRQLEQRTRELEAEAASRQAAQRALAHQARHDQLTGLLYRDAFAGDVEPLVSRNRCGAVVLVDLDRFRDVNDTLGHAVGDALLREVAMRLTSLIGADGLACRLGGDVFAAFSPTARTCAEAMTLARRVATELREQFNTAGLTLEIEASVGVACAPVHAEDPTSLLRMADLAMYSAKTSRSGACMYDPSMGVHTPRRLAVFGELRRALSENELVVHYQPVVELETHAVAGVEALIRWEHPERGLIMPCDFLDVAEQTGLIHPLTDYVLERALHDCRRWRDDSLPLSVAVNLSTRRLMDVELPGDVGRLLDGQGLPPSALVLEVTETAAMSDPDRALAVLRDLSAMGIDLSIDDYGTGHASLAYLSRLPVTTLKIDKSFVLPMETDPAHQAIIRSTLDLAHSLGLRVVAEGVEVASTYHRLAALGCHYAQGYWLAHPMPAADVPDAVVDLHHRLAPSTPRPAAARPRVPRQQGLVPRNR